MSDLKVPFAIDDNDKLHSPNEAKKGVNYFCPNCHDPLIFRNGEVNVAHFAHKTSLTCSNESIEHKTAKLLVLNSINDYLNDNGKKPKFIRRCVNCNNQYDIQIPNNSQLARLEYRLPCGFIGDVVITENETALLVIEIKISHAVDRKKHSNISTDYIELDGYKVIGNNGDIPIIKSKLKNVYCCYDCEILHKRRDRDNKLAIDRMWLLKRQREDNDLRATRHPPKIIQLTSEELSDSAIDSSIIAINNSFEDWNKAMPLSAKAVKPSELEQPKVIKNQLTMF